MRQPLVISSVLAALIGLSACDKSGDAQVERALQDMDAVQQSNLDDVMLTVGDPSAAISYFQAGLSRNPDRIDMQRGLAKSYVRAGRPDDGVVAWQNVIARPDANNDDRVELADAMIRTNRWDDAAAMLNTIPPTHETFKRYRLEAMVADGKQQWDKADSFYETAAGLTTTPAGVLNNWGYSKLTRGDYTGAERLFTDALRLDGGMFTAKNNLILARGAQRKYDLPVVPMTQVERAQLLYTMALTAIKQNDVTIGKGLLREAIDTHPQHFEEASRALAALEANVSN